MAFANPKRIPYEARRLEPLAQLKFMRAYESAIREGIHHSHAVQLGFNAIAPVPVGQRVARYDQDVVAVIKQRKALGLKPTRRKPPRMRYPASIERNYQRYLVSLVSVLTELVDQMLVPALPSIFAEANLLRPERSDDYWSTISRIFAGIRVAYLGRRSEQDVRNFIQDTGLKTSDFNKQEIQRMTYTVLAVNVFQSEPWLEAELKAFVEQNVSLVKSIEEDYLKDLEGRVTRAVQQGQRHEALAREIQERYRIPKNRAKFIARDQVAKLNGQLSMLRQTNLEIKRYIWRTSLDERVRPTHRQLEGKVFSWDRPPASLGLHPGQDYNCRCYAEPVFPEIE